MASETGGVKAFSIQGRLYRERERIAFGGMTEEERIWRKQWLADQVLSECEPYEVPELTRSRTNIFKRIYRKPLDVLVFDKLKNRISPFSALFVRNIIGKSLTLMGLIYATTYYFKYNQNDWTRKGGWRVLTSRPACLPGETYNNKVKYDPSQEESYDLPQSSSPPSDSQSICKSSENPESTEKEHQAEESNWKELGDKKCEEIIVGLNESQRANDDVENKSAEAESNKVDTNVYTSCPTVEPVEVEPSSQPPKKSPTRDKGPNYRSLGSYYASREFENSPI